LDYDSSSGFKTIFINQWIIRYGMDWKCLLKPNKYYFILMIPNIPLAIGIGAIISMLFGLIIPPIQKVNFFILWGIFSLGIDYFLSVHMYSNYVSASDKRKFIIKTIVTYSLLYIVIIAFFLWAVKYH